MRKTFKLFCAAALAVLAVSSCGKIWDEFDVVHGELDDLKAKVEALEEKLNSEVATLNTKLGALEQADKDLKALITANSDALAALNEELDALDGVVDGYITSNDAALKAAIEDYKKADAALKDVDTEILAALAGVNVINVAKNEDGNVVITFADKSTIEVPANPATGIVTVVDGKWAVVVDGKVTELDALVHPDTTIDFKVDENNELLVSYDGKKSWEKTGVVVNDETTFNVVEAFEYEEGDPYVTLTVGGVDYVLPVYKADTSSLVLGRTEAYFVYGATKTVTLKAEDVEEYYVMSKPDGWKATIEDAILTIKAPSQTLIEMGAAEGEGEVLVHATSVTGTCKVVKLDVKAGVALKVSIKDGIVTLFNATVIESKDPMWGDVWYDFANAWFGLTPIAEYLEYESFEAFMATEPEPLSNLQGILFNNVEDQENYTYKDGEYEEFVASMSLVDIVEGSYSGFELDEEEVYVMWVVPQGESSFNYDDAVYVVTDSYVEVDDTESVYNNVSMDAVFYGADGFVVGATDKAQFDNGWDVGVDGRTYEDALEEYLAGSWMPGPLANFNGGDLTAMGDMFAAGAHSLDLEDLIISAGMGGGMMPMPGMGAGASVSPDTEYFVWVIPYYEDKAEYTFDDLELLTVKTAPLVYNADIKATVTLGEVTASSVVIELVPAEGGSTAFELMTAESFEEFKIDGAVDQDMLVDYMKNGWAITEEDLYGEPAYVDEYGSWMIEPSTSYVYVTYNKVGGEYSIDYSLKFTTPSDVEVATPDKKQWITENADLGETLFGEARYVLDLGAVVSVDYSDNGVTWAMGTSYEDLYGETAAGMWMVGPGMFGTSYAVEPTDEESGVITINGVEVPYSDYTGTTCTFDFTELWGVADVECILAEEEIHLMIQ